MVDSVQQLRSRLEALTREHYVTDDPGHDYLHLRRVVDTCVRLGRELGARLEILLAAAFLHDVVNVPKNSPDRARASAMAAEQAAALLRRAELGYSDADIAAVGQAILEHSFSAGHRASSLESAILQDADRLDAIGAVGVMRTVSCGARMKSTYYHPEEPLPLAGDDGGPSLRRALDDRAFTVDHFFTKLLRLEAQFNTEPARREARRRTQFLRDFLAELEHEIRPET